ncbi:metaxin-1 isoform X4 [Bombus pyrosoma]|uniref:metaxin-1 isoform X4 n=1 Tax=Bombus pyrosoma TaxID=396416 RepID=UPI001CB98CF4|nr:metaxin-1 isoform X4 [Bombus pyrosoma]
MDTFELTIWKGDWGLPSVDTECLQVLVYAKFNDIPLKINATSNPFNGKLPILKTNDGTFNETKDIIEYFRGKNYNTEQNLSRKECAKIMAYDTMLKEKLFPALQFIWWIDEKNVNELIRPWYCKTLPFPLNFYYPGKFERQARAMLETLYPVEDNISIIENKVYSEAQKCLTLLSTSLGDSVYFLGEEPTLLDAIVYSYLAPLLKAPLPNPALQNHLKACTNLMSYTSRISEKYFSNECCEYKTKESAQSIKKYAQNEFPNKRRNQFFAGFFATLVMATYAFSTGILEVPVKENKIANVPVEDALTYDE